MNLRTVKIKLPIKEQLNPPTRSILSGNAEIAFNYKYSGRAKYLRMQIREGKLEVILPKGMNIARADEFIIKKKVWIEKHLHKPSPSPGFTFLGNRISVQQTFDLFIKKTTVQFQKNELRIHSPQGKELNLTKVYQIWLYNEAKNYIPLRTAQIAKELNFVFNSVTIKRQRSRWGSCSSKKNLSYNFRLMMHTKEIIDYVIIHELCHLKEMNHSKRFWNLVAQYSPGYKLLRKQLKAK